MDRPSANWDLENHAASVISIINPLLAVARHIVQEGFSHSQSETCTHRAQLIIRECEDFLPCLKSGDPNSILAASPEFANMMKKNMNIAQRNMIKELKRLTKGHRWSSEYHSWTYVLSGIAELLTELTQFRVNIRSDLERELDRPGKIVQRFKYYPFPKLLKLSNSCTSKQTARKEGMIGIGDGVQIDKCDCHGLTIGLTIGQTGGAVMHSDKSRLEIAGKDRPISPQLQQSFQQGLGNNVLSMNCSSKDNGEHIDSPSQCDNVNKFFSNGENFCINGGEFTAASGDIIETRNDHSTTTIYANCAFSARHPPGVLSTASRYSNSSRPSRTLYRLSNRKRRRRWSTTQFTPVYQYHYYAGFPAMMYHPASWSSFWVPWVPSWVGSELTA